MLNLLISHHSLKSDAKKATIPPRNTIQAITPTIPKKSVSSVAMDMNAETIQIVARSERVIHASGIAKVTVG